MYVSPNFKSKAALKRALVAGDVSISAFSPGPFPCPINGTVAIEGPHFPKPHTWYASVMVKEGLVTKVLS